jgi:peptidyl-prolyl cis-trans isomerase C
MLKTHKLAALAIVTALAINPAFADDKSSAAATVNGVVISQSRVEMGVKGAESQGRPDSPELRKFIRDNLITQEVVAQEAVKEGLDKTPSVVDQLAVTKQEVLVSAFVQNYIKKHPISDDQLKKEYDNYKAQLGDKEYEISHIPVKTEAEARAIIAKLNKKAKFETLAKQSLDAGSADKGGKVGWIIPKTLPESIANALLNLKKGEYTKEPVQTQFGWDVIKLDDIRPLQAQSFDVMKPKLEQHLQQIEIQKAVSDLRANAKIE